LQKMSLRLEQPADYSAVERLTYNAFQTMVYPDGSKVSEVTEHYLVNIMRGSPAFIAELDYVGEVGGEIVAHIAYTKSKVKRPDSTELSTITFGPVSVKPELHRRGLGAEIITFSLDRAKELGYGAVIIVGHPAYYPRFGFRRAEEFGLSLPKGLSVHDGAFMALELTTGYLGSAGGVWYEDELFQFDEDAARAFVIGDN